MYTPHPSLLQPPAYPASLDGTTNTATPLTKFKSAYTFPAIMRLSSCIQSDESSCFLSAPLPLFAVPGASFSVSFTAVMDK